MFLSENLLNLYCSLPEDTITWHNIIKIVLYFKAIVVYYCKQTVDGNKSFPTIITQYEIVINLKIIFWKTTVRSVQLKTKIKIDEKFSNLKIF
jgi:hypothetical protein